MDRSAAVRRRRILQAPITLHFLIPPAAAAAAAVTAAPRLLFPRPLRCSGASENGPGGGSLKESLSSLVDEQVAELLTREENRGLLDVLEKASDRVERAKRELAEIERQQLEDRRAKECVRQLKARASEIAGSQLEIMEARAMVEEAERALSTSASESGDRYFSRDDADIDRDAERLESVKAALVSALIGTAAGLPVSLTRVSTTSQLILPLSGLGYFDPPELNLESFWSYASDGAVYVSESLLIFTFVAVGLDFFFKMGIYKLFPHRQNKRCRLKTSLEFPRIGLAGDVCSKAVRFDYKVLQFRRLVHEA